METCEDIRHTLGMNKLYKQRKETIERVFGTAKENQSFRYTQMIGQARTIVEMGAIYAGMRRKIDVSVKRRIDW